MTWYRPKTEITFVYMYLLYTGFSPKNEVAGDKFIVEGSRALVHVGKAVVHVHIYVNKQKTTILLNLLIYIYICLQLHFVGCPKGI